MAINKKVMVFGTFDIFHPGHRYFLREAKKLGDYLVVVVARDKTVEKVKKEKPYHNEEERKRVLEKSKIADKVILGNLGNKYKVIKDYRPDVIALGYDQKIFTDKLTEKLKELNLVDVKIKRLAAYQPYKYKSSLLKRINPLLE